MRANKQFRESCSEIYQEKTLGSIVRLKSTMLCIPGSIRFVFLLFCGVACHDSVLALPYFEEAQKAAAEARYQDVVRILSSAIENTTDGEILNGKDLVIAYSNRGIAYSLMESYELAMRDLEMAISLDPGHLLTRNHLGILAEHVDENPGLAASHYKLAADEGYPASQVNYGNLLKSGQGVARDPAMAVHYFKLAADAEYPIAYVALGELYMDGVGVVQDYVKGVELLQRGVAAGVITGHYYLGLAREKGLGLPVDYVKAASHYETAARQGHAPSQGALGYLYRKGLGVTKDFDQALRWYKLSADQGDTMAANRLAWILAACPAADVCDGTAALEFALIAVRSDPSPTNLDSLAASYARLGRFDEAIGVIRQIVDDDAIDGATRERYHKRLDKYQMGIPFQL